MKRILLSIAVFLFLTVGAAFFFLYSLSEDTIEESIIEFGNLESNANESREEEKEDSLPIEKSNEIKDKVSISEKASLMKLLLNKLTKKDISELKGMLPNGITEEEKSRVKEILYLRLSAEDISRIKDAYVKHTQ